MNIFQNLLINKSPKVNEALLSDSHEMVISGPRNCGKSFTLQQYAFTLHLLIPGLQSAICMMEQSTLENTTIKQIEKKLLKYGLKDRRNPWAYHINKKEIKWHNGGNTLFVGMDKNGEKVLGAELDLCIFGQAERCTREETWAHLLGAMEGGRAGNWRKGDGSKHFRLIGDVNPGNPNHFLKKRHTKGLTDFVEFDHRENPLFFDWDKKEYTDIGLKTIEGLKRAYPEGFMRDRMVYGRWCGAEGLVYPQYRPDKHVAPVTFETVRDGTWHWAVDFGGTAPHAALLISQAPDGTATVFKEIHKAAITVSQLIQEMKSIEKGFEIDISDVIPDPASKIYEQLIEAGYTTTLPQKEILSGIQLVSNAFLADKIIINEHSLVELDASRPNKPRGLKEELLSYHYAPDSSLRSTGANNEKPVATDNHACDALRYYVEVMSRGRPLPTMILEVVANRNAEQYAF